MSVKLGIEVMLEERPQLVRGARVGAVVHPASILSDYRHTADVLHAETAVNIVSLFGPQHGARGEKQDNMIESEHYRDPETGLRVHSLYSETRKPTEEMLQEIDVLLLDLQDVGTRVYTFIYTMAYCMESCARLEKRVVVLDRPNPIGGELVEGNLLDGAYRSFVGLYPIPMRHGMTIGEIARLFNVEFGIGCDLDVVPMRGWSRRFWFDDTGLPWVPPSPNIPTLDSATVYPGMVLIEGTHLSEGRGTTRPFEFVGAPYVEPRKLADRMNGLGLPGVFFRPCYFEPTFQKWKGEVCAGVQLHVTQRMRFEPCLTAIAVMSAIRGDYPDHFRWREPPYEYEHEKLPIDILAGGDGVRRMVEEGKALDEVRESWRREVARFREQREPFLLYS